jgi:hypothetical protein
VTKGYVDEYDPSGVGKISQIPLIIITQLLSFNPPDPSGMFNAV